MAKRHLTVEEVREEIAAMAPLSFRKIEDARRLALHFQEIVYHPVTQCTPALHKYLLSLDEKHKKMYTQHREGVEVEYIYASETKNNQQRQRFNSLPISEVSELLKMEFSNAEKSIKVHLCTECNVEIETNEDEPLVESLQKHFNLEVHQPKKVEPVDVSEPILLPNLSRRKSAMVERGEAIAPPATMEHLEQIMKDNLSVKMEKPEKLFSAKLETFLMRVLPSNSEASLNSAVNYYQGVYDQLCKEISSVDFSTMTSSVAPIIMSIKDNVNQNFAVENKAPDEDIENDKTQKNQVKKMRYYGPIESAICKLLSNHKLLSLTDDRTGKPAFFCMACEYYTLRFRYDSVLNHVFSDTHIHNLSAILDADENIPFTLKDKSVESIKELNQKFLQTQGIVDTNEGVSCNHCKATYNSVEQSVLHILDENHLGRQSDKIFRKTRGTNPDAPIPEDWGQKSIDWTKHLAATAKSNMARDTVIIENFIKPSGKVANYCPSCDMTLKGPRHVLFTHVRQKKHLRNVAPQKLQYLFKNHCRAAEYYASFGNYYLCAVCPVSFALPSFTSVVEHVESDEHVQSLALLIKLALHYNESEFASVMTANKIIKDGVFKCAICDETFENSKEVISHILGGLKHNAGLIEEKCKTEKKDVISAYMRGDYVVYSETAAFTCTVCQGTFASVRSLLMHLVYAEHYNYRPNAESVFRFYLELKHNIGLIVRNKYALRRGGVLECGACGCAVQDSGKRHVMSPRHRECAAGEPAHPE